MLVSSLINEFKEAYGGYTRMETVAYGWSIVAFAIILALIISRKPWKNNNLIEGGEV